MHHIRGFSFATAACLAFALVPVAAVGEDAAAKPAETAAPVEPPKPVEATRPAETATPADKASPAQDTGAEDAAAPAAPAPGSAWNAEVAPATSPEGIALSPRQIDLVDKVSKYFSDLSTLQGSFVQTGADNKRMRGKFYVKRPGRFRFDYARPSRQIVISDGRYLAIQDLDLNNEDRVALDQTPFRLLLRSDVNLVRDAKIMEVQESEDMIVIGLEDKDPNNPGQIRLFLSTKPGLELKEWVTRDPQGLNTRVEISDLAKSVDLDGNLFQIKPVGLPFNNP